MADMPDAMPSAPLNLLVRAVITVLLSAATGAFYICVDLSLNRMGASAAAIGANAAMPALAWLAATAISGFAMTSDQTPWLGLRFVLLGLITWRTAWPAARAQGRAG